MMFRTAFAFALAVALPAAAADKPLNVLATVAMVGDVAAEIGGECVAVTTLIGDGSDPHLYEATASDVRRLQQAELILHVGLNLEGQLGEVLDRLGKSRPVRAVGPLVAADRLIASDEKGGADPHLWMDPSLWAQIVPGIATEIAALRPACADAVKARAADYAAGLTALHGWVAASMASVPEAARALVTAHDAFAYYARAFGLREVAIQGISTESEASIADIREVAGTVVAAGVPAVFIETTVNPRTIEAMIEAVRAQGRAVKIGGELFSDAMGAANTPEGSYVGMIRHNTRTIVTALGGTPAPWPAALAPWAARWGVSG